MSNFETKLLLYINYLDQQEVSDEAFRKHLREFLQKDNAEFWSEMNKAFYEKSMFENENKGE